MASSKHMEDKNFSDNFGELRGLISSAFYGRNKKRDEDVVLLMASLIYLRNFNALIVKKTVDVDENVYHRIIRLQIEHPENRCDLCLCFEKDLLENINDIDFRLLLERTLAVFGEANEPRYVFEFVDVLNKQDFQEGGLLALLDKSVDDLYFNYIEGDRQPKELTRIVSYLVDDNAKKIFDPFGGHMDFATAMPDKHFVGYEIKELTRDLALFRMALAGVNNHSVLYHKSAEYWTEDVFDAIVTYPPFAYKIGMRDSVFDVKTDVDQAILARFERTTNAHGQLVIVTAISTLFKESSPLKQYREDITKKNWLDKVVVLPSYMFYPKTQILTAIVVLKKDRKKDEKIRFVDATQCIQMKSRGIGVDVDKMISIIDATDGIQSIDVTMDDIIENKSSWLVGWYLYQRNTVFREGYDILRFKDVFETAPSTKQFDETTGHLVNSEAFSRSTLIHFEYKPEDFLVTDDLRGTKRISKPVVLVNRTGLVFPIYCEASEDNPIFIKASAIEAYCIKTKDNNIGYLCIELFHRYASLSKYVSPFSNKKVFEELQLSFPSVEEQKNLYEDMKRTSQEAKIKELGLQNVIDDYKKQLRARKHAISQNLSAFSALWNTLYRFKRKNGGQLNDSDVVSVSYNRTVADVFEALNERLNVILQQADHLADDEPDWGEPEEIDPTAFIEEYIKTHSDIRFEYIRGYDVEEYNGMVEALGMEVFLEFVFPKKALVRIFDNIISNAVSHGFTDAERKDYKILITRDVGVDSVNITISNNGNAIPDGFNLKKLFDYGYTTKSLEGHSGLGAYQVNELMSRFHGSVEVVSTPDKSYTVTYILTFKELIWN